jgi:23S rRNA (guanine745-N1)-methyltransferase
LPNAALRRSRTINIVHPEQQVVSTVHGRGRIEHYVNVAFRCPHCLESLAERQQEYVCPSGHHFDRAKEGYVNLLPGGRLKSRPAGDDDSMVRARRRVFDAGLYDPVIGAVAASVAHSPVTNIVDAGCGEGSYLAAAATLSGAAGWGIDISKPAIRLASRRHRAHRYAIASSYALPFADNSFEALINVFSPRDFAEMLRVLAPGGRAIVATPGPRHLAQLKALVYNDPRPHVDRSDTDTDAAADEPSPDHVSSVQFERSLDDQDLRLSLLEMTPFWWSTTPERREVIAATPLVVDIDIQLWVYRKPNGSAPVQVL